MVVKLTQDERDNKRTARSIKIQYNGEVQRTFPMDLSRIAWTQDEKRMGGFVRNEKSFYDQAIKVAVDNNPDFENDCDFMIDWVNFYASDFKQHGYIE